MTKKRRSNSRRGRKKSSLLKRAILTLLLFTGGVLGYTGYQFYHSPEDFDLSEALDYGRNLAESASGQIRTSELPALLDRSPAEPGEELIARVIRVVDGDTIVIQSGAEEEKIRMLCVDTPESVHSDQDRNHPLGKKASAFTRSVLENRQVRILSEKETHDRFGRRLGYVIHEGEVFNIRLVREGHSPYYTKYGKSELYHREFQRAEREAKREDRGIWASPDFVEAFALSQ